jgi:hypothetical protein
VSCQNVLQKAFEEVSLRQRGVLILFTFVEYVDVVFSTGNVDSTQNLLIWPHVALDRAVLTAGGRTHRAQRASVQASLD